MNKKSRVSGESTRPKNNSLTVRIDDLRTFEPITQNQSVAFQAWDDGDNLVLAGSAGTGKTFIAMYLALEEVLDPQYPQDKIVLIRSMVPTRDMGFLPGTVDEKQEAFISLYKSMCTELFGDSASYGKMVSAKQLQFESTSYIRGATYNNAIIIVDEMQNLNFHELDSVITRVGKNSKIIFCGDYHQSDFRFKDEKEGIFKFLSIIEQLKGFSVVTFGWDDIVRSGLVRDYIMTKEMLGITNEQATRI